MKLFGFFFRVARLFMHNYTTHNLLVRILPLFTLVPSSRVSKKPFLRTTTLPTFGLSGHFENFELVCAWAMIHFSKAHDQIFLAGYNFPNGWKTVCSSKVPKGWKRRLRTKNPFWVILGFNELHSKSPKRQILPFKDIQTRSHLHDQGSVFPVGLSI